jgi:hypothetical protein
MARLVPAAALLLLVAPTAVNAASPPEPAGERVILGFEEAEFGQGDDVSREEKPGRESWFYLLEQDDGFDFAARFESPGATNRAWTWRCRRGPHTEGETALVATVGPVKAERLEASYRRTEFLSDFYPGLRGNFEAHRVMTTFQWLTRADASLRDWSGYDFLRIDVRTEKTPVKLRLALEDEILEPPVMRTYQVPPGKWVTLELDLNQAVRARGLRLDEIANFWLLGRASRRAEVRIDNIRIAKRGAALN